VFNETVIFTTRRAVRKRVTAQGAVFVLQNILAKRLFGVKTLWRGSMKVAVSGPARTLVDLLAMPEAGSSARNLLSYKAINDCPE
jgi:predicted transcriptional regulator of viral defense system